MNSLETYLLILTQFLIIYCLYLMKIVHQRIDYKLDVIKIHVTPGMTLDNPIKID